MEPQQPSSSKAIIWIIVLVILIGLGTYFVVGRGTHSSNEDTAGTFSNISTIANNVEVKDQLTGSSVIVSNIALDKGGFVVIRDDNAGTPGKVIGATYFERGERPGTVDLSTPTQNNKTYYAELYTDNGDKKFVEGTDLRITDTAGNPIMGQFKALNVLPDIKG